MLFYSVMALASIVAETNAEKPAPPPPVIIDLHWSWKP